MADSETTKDPESKGQHPDNGLQSDTLQSIALALAFRTLADRIAGLEERLAKPSPTAKSWGTTLLEFSRVLFGGWPALGFIFLVLFYSPLRDALNAIPEKVRSADEIGAFGVSLKSTIQREAIKLGAGKLSETIPRLSAKAIEQLFHAQTNEESLFSYHQNENGQIDEFYYPAEATADTLAELQRGDLIQLVVGAKSRRNVDGQGLNDYLRNLEKQYSGDVTKREYDGRKSLTLRSPLPKGSEVPYLAWQLTDLGKKAVEVIISSVAAELSSTARPIGAKPK